MKILAILLLVCLTGCAARSRRLPPNCHKILMQVRDSTGVYHIVEGVRCN